MDTIYILVFTVISAFNGIGGGMAGTYPSRAACQADMTPKTVATIREKSGLDQQNPAADLKLHCLAHKLPKFVER